MGGFGRDRCHRMLYEASCARYAKPATALISKDLLQIVDFTNGAVGQSVRTLPRPAHCHGQLPPLFDKTRHVYIQYIRDAFRGCFTFRWRITEITQLSAFGISLDNASAIDNKRDLPGNDRR